MTTLYLGVMVWLIKMMSLTLVVFSLLTVRVNGQEDLEMFDTAKTIMQAITSRFDSGYKCTTMTVVNNVTLSNEFLSLIFGQVMVFTDEFMAGRNEYVSSILRDEVSCLVGVSLMGSKFDNVVHASRKNWQHVTLKVGGSKPQKQEVAKATYPIIHIGKKPKVQVSLFCPKINPQNSSWQKTFSAKLLERPKSQSKLFCSGYLEGQNVIRAGSYADEVRIIDGKPEYGDFGVRMNNYMSKIFNYNTVNVMGPTIYFAHNDSWGGNQGMVAAGKYFLTSGRHTPQFYRHFELLVPFLETSYGFVSRKPNVLERVDNVFRPFSMDIWILVIATMLCFSVVFYVVHNLYSKKMWKQNFHRNEHSPINFFLYSFCKITEPDPVPWFTEKWSAGKLLSFQWSLFCLLIVAIYTCNLRAHLAVVDYEKPIDSAEDVVAHGKKTWLMSELIANNLAYLERSGQTGTPFYKVVKKATEVNSYFSLSKSLGLPEEALEEILHEGAIAVYHREFFNHQILFNPRYKNILSEGNGLYMSKENAFDFAFCAVLTKYSPVRVEIGNVFLDAIERGLMVKWQNEPYSLRYFLNWNALEVVNERKPLRFLQIFVPLMFWVFGCILGMLMFIGEIPKTKGSFAKPNRLNY